MTVEDIMPPFDLAQRRIDFREVWRERLLTRLLGDVVVHNFHRVEKLVGSDKLCKYVYGPHTSMEDYVTPGWVILDRNLPYALTITGKNLDSPLTRLPFGLDLTDWGVILHKRNGQNIGDYRDYSRAILTAYQRGFSVAGWPEGADPNGARTRRLGVPPREFPAAFYKPDLSARRRLGKDILVQCVAFKPTKIPETEFYGGMNRTAGTWIYSALDAAAALMWRFFVRDKGRVHVNFAEPVEILDLAGQGSSSEQANRLAIETRKIITDLWNEIED